MASNSPTLMQSEEKLLEELNSDPPSKDYTVCVVMDKVINTSNIDSVTEDIRRYLTNKGWYVDTIEIDEE